MLLCCVVWPALSQQWVLVISPCNIPGFILCFSLMLDPNFPKFGSYKIASVSPSVCLSVSLSVMHLSQNWVSDFLHEVRGP